MLASSCRATAPLPREASSLFVGRFVFVPNIPTLLSIRSFENTARALGQRAGEVHEPDRELARAASASGGAVERRTLGAALVGFRGGIPVVGD